MLSFKSLSILALAVNVSAAPLKARNNTGSNTIHTKVVVLGGGVAGSFAAIELSKLGVTDWVLLEARDELGGRMQDHQFGDIVIERGPNWVQGTGDNPRNPIWQLALDYNLKVGLSDFSDFNAYDNKGEINATSEYNAYGDALTEYLALAGTRQDNNIVDLNARGGLRLAGWNPLTSVERAVEAYNFDMEYASNPESSSWIQSSNNNNFTFDGYSPDNQLSIDPRGFKVIVQGPMAALKKKGKIMLNQTVTTIAYSTSNVKVVTKEGLTVIADYAIVTFSVGVLQNSDVTFEPELPDWKQQAIAAFKMSTYTKVFLQFETKFWEDNQFALYADPYNRARWVQFQNLDAEGFFPGSKTIFTTALDYDSIRIESMSDTAVKNEIVSVLKGMYGASAVSNVTNFYFPKWHKDPLFRGSYSNWPAGYPVQELDNLRAALPATSGQARLLFAGEATSFRYYGFLHGALQEGQHAAQKISSCLSSSSRPGCLNEPVYYDIFLGGTEGTSLRS